MTLVGQLSAGFSIIAPIFEHGNQDSRHHFGVIHFNLAVLMMIDGF
jgi:hypothetical protein